MDADVAALLRSMDSAHAAMDKLDEEIAADASALVDDAVKISSDPAMAEGFNNAEGVPSTVDEVFGDVTRREKRRV